MNSTFIIVLFLLVLPGNALFCKGFWNLCSLLWNYRLWQIRAELGKLLLPVSSKIGSKRERFTTKDQRILKRSGIYPLHWNFFFKSADCFFDRFGQRHGWKIHSCKLLWDNLKQAFHIYPFITKKKERFSFGSIPKFV